MKKIRILCLVLALTLMLTACGEKAYKIGCVAKTGEDGERLVLK